MPLLVDLDMHKLLISLIYLFVFQNFCFVRSGMVSKPKAF
jgi:hypothetical protein